MVKKVNKSKKMKTVHFKKGQFNLATVKFNKEKLGGVF
jgi:hypothetical protein